MWKKPVLYRGAGYFGVRLYLWDSDINKNLTQLLTDGRPAYQLTLLVLQRAAPINFTSYNEEAFAASYLKH